MATFWTTGEDLTRLIRDFIQSGLFANAIAILEDGEIPEDSIKQFLLGKAKLIGSTREDGLSFVDDEDNKIDYLAQGCIQLCSEDNISHGDIYSEWNNKHFEAILKYFTKDEFRDSVYKTVLVSEGYVIYEEPPLSRVTDGVFLQNGVFVECGFQEHVDLYYILNNLKLSSCRSWTDDVKCIHISSGSLSGKVSYSIRGNLYPEATPTKAQIQALVKWKEHFNSFYSERRGGVMNHIRKRFIMQHGKGTKYGNLRFLEEVYDFKVANISLINKWDVTCIRTSPERSLPGILNSYFNIKKEDVESVEKEIKDEWQGAKNLREGNELHYFFQEFIPGKSGVCHYKEKGNFSYSIGENQHDIVGGKIGSYGNIEAIHNILRPVAREIYNDIKKQIQLEFVENEGKITITQLRIINTPLERVEPPKNILCIGRSFTPGDIIVSRSECLVVQNEVDSIDCLGKKAIIVRDNVEFSHALALSQAFNIPSIYNIGDYELPEKFKINTQQLEGFICKLE